MTVANGGEGGTQDDPCPCGPCRERAQKHHVRAGRWIVRHSDLTKAPAPLLRWLGILLVGIVYVAIGAPRRLGDWLWLAIIGGFLIFPDVAGFGVAGVRLDLKKTQDELNAVKVRLDLRQLQVSGGLHLYGEEAAARVLGRSVPAAAGEQAARNAQFTLVTFPGLPAIVPSARRFVRGILAGSPRADDMGLITAELASNAIRHTPSGQDGGEWLEVSDTGTGEWSGPRDAADDDEYGRGLAIVAELSDKFGHDVRAGGQTVWAEVAW